TSTNMFFIQIGACDGISFDPLFFLTKKYKMHGVLLEPIPHLFEELKKNYKDIPNIELVNKAISSVNGTIEMQTITEDGLKRLPKWAKGISTISSDKNALGNNYWEEGKGKEHKEYEKIYEEIKKYRKPIKVDSIDFEKLLDMYNINKIDLLQIDAEGYDYEIIKLINFDNVKPKIIHFEIANLDNDEKKSCLNLLTNNGYSVVQYNKQDALATLNLKR
ncbi:MAG: FkbM family methyltransferase, partial [Bacteroidetes bacterium]|nr:FkbM family methyltransferase [Bacteroidota bacterium]